VEESFIRSTTHNLSSIMLKMRLPPGIERFIRSHNFLYVALWATLWASHLFCVDNQPHVPTHSLTSPQLKRTMSTLRLNFYEHSFFTCGEPSLHFSKNFFLASKQNQKCLSIPKRLRRDPISPRCRIGACRPYPCLDRAPTHTLIVVDPLRSICLPSHNSIHSL
jgi:hypothetical protein